MDRAVSASYATPAIVTRLNRITGQAGDALVWVAVAGAVETVFRVLRFLYFGAVDMKEHISAQFCASLASNTNGSAPSVPVWIQALYEQFQAGFPMTSGQMSTLQRYSQQLQAMQSYFQQQQQSQSQGDPTGPCMAMRFHGFLTLMFQGSWLWIVVLAAAAAIVVGARVLTWVSRRIDCTARAAHVLARSEAQAARELEQHVAITRRQTTPHFLRLMMASEPKPWGTREITLSCCLLDEHLTPEPDRTFPEGLVYWFESSDGMETVTFPASTGTSYGNCAIVSSPVRPFGLKDPPESITISDVTAAARRATATK